MASRTNTHRIRALALTAAIAGTSLIGLAAPASAQDSDGPIVGTPPFEDAIPAWLDVYTDPDYYTSYITEALYSNYFAMPWPFDAVKPEAFLNVVPVADGDYTSELPESSIDLSQITYEHLGETKTVSQFLHTTNSDGITFAIDGQLVYEDYANGYSPDVRHQPWSVTKTFVAALIGIGLDEGHYTLDDPIDMHIPELAGTSWAGVRIEDILQMESGVHWDEGTPVLVVNTQVEQWVQTALDLYSDGQVGQTRNEFLASLPQDYEPGTTFSYNSGNTQVLAWLLETKYGMTFNDIVSEMLWKPMGAAGDAVMIADREGSVIASQGLYARPHDFIRFGELLRHDGVTPEGHRVLPAGWVKQMTTMTEISNGAYGLQTWSARLAADDAYTGSGFQGQKITVLPSSCITGVRLSHAFGADLREGDDPFDPEAYRFEAETYSDQWEKMLRAIADEHGGCTDGAGDVLPVTETSDNDPPVNPDSDVAAAESDLPATGGGLAGLGLLVGLGASRLRRRRG